MQMTLHLDSPVSDCVCGQGRETIVAELVAVSQLHGCFKPLAKDIYFVF